MKIEDFIPKIVAGQIKDNDAIRAMLNHQTFWMGNLYSVIFLDSL